MIGLALIPTAGRLLRKVTPQAWLIVVTLAGVVLMLGYCTTQARQDERRRAEADRAEAYARRLEREAAADEKASITRMDDFQTTIDREKERTDATAQIPDTRPSDRRIARACVQLRQQGTAERNLPSACR